MKKPARKADEEAPAKEKEIGVKAFLAELDALWKQYSGGPSQGAPARVSPTNEFRYSGSWLNGEPDAIREHIRYLRERGYDVLTNRERWYTHILYRRKAQA